MNHHLVHEGGWTLELHAGRRTTWRTPDGTVYFDGTTDRLHTESRRPAQRWHRPHRGDVVADVADDLTAALDAMLGASAGNRPP